MFYFNVEKDVRIFVYMHVSRHATKSFWCMTKSQLLIVMNNNFVRNGQTVVIQLLFFKVY